MSGYLNTSRLLSLTIMCSRVFYAKYYELSSRVSLLSVMENIQNLLDSEDGAPNRDLPSVVVRHAVHPPHRPRRGLRLLSASERADFVRCHGKELWFGPGQGPPGQLVVAHRCLG